MWMVKYSVNTHGRIENFYSEYHDYLSHIFFERQFDHENFYSEYHDHLSHIFCEGNLRCNNQNVTNLGLIWMEGE